MKKFLLILVLLVCALFTLSALFLPKYFWSPSPTGHIHPLTESTLAANQLLDKENPVLHDDYQFYIAHFLRSFQAHDFRYYFQTFVETKEGTAVIVNFRNSRYQFDVLLKIDELQQLKRMYKTNGKGYPKELYAMKWRIDKDEQVWFDGMFPIID